LAIVALRELGNQGSTEAVLVTCDTAQRVMVARDLGDGPRGLRIHRRDHRTCALGL